jgi:hypothetical protein
VALGDGIRRNIATVNQQERDRFRNAIIALHQTQVFPGSRTDFPAGGVSWWFKQDEIHQATHVHGGPAFIPWHRELCNRLEAMLRTVDPDLSLHYWDWTTDPAPLFTNTFMGNANGDAGDPWLSAGLYNPNPVGDNYRDNFIHSLNQPTPNPSTWSYAVHANPADPPKDLTRAKQGGAPPIGSPGWPSESDIVGQPDFPSMRQKLEQVHNNVHGYIGGTIGNPHTSFRDPFVFLLHSNVDRMFAMWQAAVGHPDRLDPNQIYGSESFDPAITNPLQPWAGTSDWPVRPWYTPENEQVVKNCKHPSVVTPPCYDTLPNVPATVTLQTPAITFNDVPAGETAARAVVFSIVACHDVSLSITAGPTVLTGPPGTNFGVLLGTSVTVHQTGSITPPLGRLWISYKGTNAGDVATGTVTVHCAETNQDFVVPISANTIARPKVAVMLTLDQSGSMGWLAGTDATTKRIDVLHQAATNFVQLAQDSSRAGDGVGMVSFDNNAYPGVAVTRNMGTGFDLAAVVSAIQALQPQGATSIGNGLALARDTLNPVTGYDKKAHVVFTDGLENTSLYISDVIGTINDPTFAIGLGTAQQVSIGALNRLTNNTGGYVLLSGRLSPAVDDYFRLTKYFLQILAGVTTNHVVTDPAGYITPGMKLRIPFRLTEADIDSTVILLTDAPLIRFLIETPAGDIMSPAEAALLGATYGIGTNMSYYRFTLPLPLGGHPAQAGTWYALLQFDEIILRRHLSKLDRSEASRAAVLANGIRYSLSAHAYSNLRMQAAVSQNSLQPGATLTLGARLSEYGIPVDHRANVWAELTRPDDTRATLALKEIEPGVFEASTLAGIEGVYRFHVVASGITMSGTPFTREQLLSGAVVMGGDNPPPTTGPSTQAGDKQLCELLECLLCPQAIGDFATKHKIDPNVIRACVERWCKERLAPPSAEELRKREGTI